VDVVPSSTTINEHGISPKPSSPAAIPESPTPGTAEAMGSGQENVPDDPPPEQPQIEEQDAPLRRSHRVRRSTIPNDYEVYVSEDMTLEGDPTTYEEAMRSPDSSKWLAAMEDEMRSMDTNKVWDLEEIPKGAKKVCCKWVYKTKRDSRGNIERYKACLVAKLRERESIITKPSHLFHRRTPLESLWHLLPILIWSYIKWM